MKSKRTDYREGQGRVRRLVGIALLPLALLAVASPVPGNAQDARGLRYENAPDRTGNVVTITAPITTEFGTYVPYRIPKYTPAIGRYEGGVRSDLTNVILPDDGFSWNYFSNAERGMFARDQVVIRAEPIGTFAQAYNGSAPTIPPFITVDAALGGLRSTLQEAYDQVRRDRLAPDLDGVLTALSSNVAGGLGGETSDDLRDGLGRLLAWLETGRSLLDPSVVPDSRVAPIVADELERIERGVRAESELLGRDLDYRRMNPGSIEESGELGRYVAARRWLSEAGPRLGGSDDEAMMAALMARMVDALDQRSRERLADIVAVESFFAGADEQNLRLDAISGGMRSWYGFQYEGGYGFLGQSDAVDRVRAYMAQYRGPGVEDRMQTGLLPSESRMGEGMIALAGSGAKMVEGLKSKGTRGFASAVASIPAEGWVRSNDAVALYTASVLAEQPEGERNLPSFMRSDTWTERRGESAIGAFTGFLAPSGVVNVRSGGITARAAAPGSGAGGFVGYVEPDPAAWAAVASYAGYVRNGLVDGPRGRMIDPGLERKLQDIENMSAQFTGIAAAELAGTSLSTEQRNILGSAPAHIAAWETPLDSQSGLQITAGSAAGNGKGGAVGHPMAIYVLVPDVTGEYFLTRGAVYDYREASEPTDAWVERLTGGNADGSLPLDAFRAVDGRITEVTPPLQKTSSRATSGAVQLELESNVVRRTEGAVWFTIRADGYERSNVVATVVDQSGRTVYTSRSMRIENGERLDMIPTEDLRSGQYFIRISDITDRILASGRFMVVR